MRRTRSGRAARRPLPHARRGAISTAVAVLLSPTSALGAQAPQETESFLREVQTAGRRFAELGVAVAEGYRKLGPDFPGMGEHWVHPGLVIAGDLDPTRPPVIGYTLVNGERRLISFAYTRVLGPHELPPAAPFPQEAWHDHTGGVDEESLLLSGPMSVHEGDHGFRLSMVHLWLDTDNPDGTLAQNNWALPFLRAGVASPEGVSSEAARALSLSTDEGAAFYDELLREGVQLDGPELDRATAAFEDAARASGVVSERMGTEGLATGEDIRALEAIWAELWTRLERRLSSRSLTAMAVLRS